MNNDLWSEMSEMVEAGRLASGSAERSVLYSLLKAIEKIISVDKRLPDTNTRIWTIHRIVNNRIFFHDSSFRKPDRSIYQSLESGLIGRAIADGQSIRRFPDATNQIGYVEGWEKTKSELICLIHDEDRIPIGVINIESDFLYDFFTKKDGEERLDELVEPLKVLESIVVFAANVLSPIFRARNFKSQGQCWESLAYQFERTKSDNFIKETLKKGLDILPHFLPVLVAGVYTTNFNASEDSPSEDEFHLISRMPAPDAAFPVKIPEKAKIEKMYDLDRSSFFFSKEEVSKIFGKEFSIDILSNDGSGEVLIQAGNLHNENLDFGGKLILIVVLDKSAKHDKKDTYEKEIKDFFILFLSFVRIFVLEEIERYSESKQKTISAMLKISAQNSDLQSIMNEITDNILTVTKSRFCLIYLKGPDKIDQSLQTFFAIGSSPKDISFTNKMIPMKSLLGKTVLEGENYNYQPDFFNCKWGNKDVISELKQYGLEKPEVFIQIFSRMNERISLGAIILVREGANRPIKPGEFIVKKMLSEFSNYVGQIYDSKIKNITNDSLSKSYGALFNLLPSLIDGDSEKGKVKSFFDLNNKIIAAALKPLSKSAYFVIYKRSDLKFLMHNSLQESTEIRPNPPQFSLNKGLTGSVMLHHDGEIFEPYVDRVTYKTPQNSDDENVAIVANPDSTCQEYWDKMLGSPERFFYGLHVRIDVSDYILIVIGVRGNDFNPNIGQIILHDLTLNIAEQFRKIMTVNSIDGKVSWGTEETNVLEKLIRRDSTDLTEEEGKTISAFVSDFKKFAVAGGFKAKDNVLKAQDILFKVETVFTKSSKVYAIVKGIINSLIM